MVSYAIKCDNADQKELITHYFMNTGYSINTFHGNDDLATFINPHDKELLFSTNQTADDNFKDNGYIVINFELFTTILGFR
jgi:Na+-transporting NADH:ubiquinone oxidoreductase subunit NqrF